MRRDQVPDPTVKCTWWDGKRLILVKSPDYDLRNYIRFIFWYPQSTPFFSGTGGYKLRLFHRLLGIHGTYSWQKSAAPATYASGSWEANPSEGLPAELFDYLTKRIIRILFKECRARLPTGTSANTSLPANRYYHSSLPALIEAISPAAIRLAYLSDIRIMTARPFRN